MNKKSRRLLTWCLVVCMVITQMLFTNMAFASTRYSGSDRYATALDIVTKGWAGQKSEFAVIARGDQLADALCAAPLAYAKGKAPIFLTNPNTLSAGILDELKTLGVKTVYIAGGTGAVSQGIQDTLGAAGYTVKRLAGNDRIGTSMAIAAELGATKEVALVNAYAFADALSISSIAASKGMAIILTNGTLSDSVKGYITGKTVYAIGGSGVISDALVASAKATRIAGIDRYETNAAVLNAFKSSLNFGTVYFANGADTSAADSLAGSALAAKTNSPIVLVDVDHSKNIDKAAAVLKANLKPFSNIVLLGGSGVLAESVGAAAEALRPVLADTPNSGIEIASAQNIGNSTVTVTLKDDPKVTLTASDFVISPELMINSVTTDNNVVTIQTSEQTEGTVYTVSTMAGKGTAQFTGKAPVDPTGVIKSVTIPNLRQMVITFTRPILYWSANSTDNYYIGLTPNKDADLQLKSLTELAKNGNWIVSAGSQDVLKDTNNDGIDDAPDTSAKASYVVIESTDGSLLKDLGLVYNENATVEVRNIKDANGYINTSQGFYTVVDNKTPSVSCTPIVTIAAGATKATANKLAVTFNEPVKTMAQNVEMKFYIDNLLVNPANITGNVNYSTVAAHETFYINVFGLDRDVQHTLKVVGAMDLHDNVIDPNYSALTFKVVNGTAKAPTLPARPNVVAVNQIADNIFQITFDQPGVISYNGMNSVTVKASTVNGNDKWVNMTENNGLLSIDKSGVANGNSVWTVYVNADYARVAGLFDYDTNKLVVRTVEVRNYITQFATQVFSDNDDQLYYVGPVYTNNYSFVHDTTAPVVGSNKGYNVAGRTLYVSFKDAPFDGIVQNGVGTVRVSMTNSRGQSFEQDFTIDGIYDAVNVGTTDVTVNGVTYEAGKYVAIVIPQRSVLLDSKSNLVQDAVYSIAFPKGAVKDADRVNEEKVEVKISGDNNVNGILNDYHMMAKTTVSIVIPAAVTPTTPEGRVPQTDRGLIFSVQEFYDSPNGKVFGYNNLLSLGSPADPLYLLNEDNLDKIFVFFDGEVLESSALNMANYRFNGISLDKIKGAKINYFVAKNAYAIENGFIANAPLTGIDGKAHKNVGYVVITLPANSVERSGRYTIHVEGITNKSGKRMLPVDDSTALVDNTAPVAQSVRAIGSKELELTFNEAVKFSAIESDNAAQRAINNFGVTVDGVKYAVSAVTLSTKDPKKVTLTVAQDFDVNGSVANVKVVVTVKKDADGNMFLTDTSAVPNDLLAGVTVHN